MNVRRLGRLFPILAGCIAHPAHAGAQVPPPCPVPGHVIRWEASYCMFLSETDDLELASVQECLAHFPLRGYDKRMSECERKTTLRRALCHLLIDHGYFDGSLESCESSPETIPPFVTGDD